MRYNSLFAKSSKCYFVVARVEYLGYFISGEGGTTQPTTTIQLKPAPMK